VDYGREVVETRPVRVGSRVPALDVVTRDAQGSVHVRRACNIVLAPYLPRGVTASERIWHSSALLHAIPTVVAPPRRIAVVGAGQSAAVELAVESLIDGTRFVLTSDVVVFATGYRPTDPRGVLGELTAQCRTDRGGRLEITRDYRIVTDDDVEAGIYVQGATEHTHGITSTLLSTTAIRSAEIVAAVAASRRAPVPADAADVPVAP
jgi:lysine/ornithine N-monooxygenase